MLGEALSVVDLAAGVVEELVEGVADREEVLVLLELDEDELPPDRSSLRRSSSLRYRLLRQSRLPRSPYRLR